MFVKFVPKTPGSDHGAGRGNLDSKFADVIQSKQKKVKFLGFDSIKSKTSEDFRSEYEGNVFKVNPGYLNTRQGFLKLRMAMICDNTRGI